MLAEIALETLRFFDRAALEGLQMHSRYLRNLVSLRARTLPLRFVNDVVVITSRIYLKVKEKRKKLGPLRSS